MRCANVSGMGRLQRAEHAKVHHAEMLSRYGSEIQACVANTEVFTPNTVPDKATSIWATRQKVMADDTVSALFKLDGRRICLLNFASFRKPGGGFMTGSFAQEEALCHQSILYEVLEQFGDTFYTENLRYLHKCMYTDRMLYTPGVVFEQGGRNVKKADVLTCAAPNLAAARGVSREENTVWLKRRIDRIFTVAESKGVETFIVGAWGCGVFGQDPNEVATLMHERASTFTGSDVVFAIPPSRNGNYQTFKEVISGRAS